LHEGVDERAGYGDATTDGVQALRSSARAAPAFRLLALRDEGGGQLMSDPLSGPWGPGGAGPDLAI